MTVSRKASARWAAHDAEVRRKAIEECAAFVEGIGKTLMEQVLTVHDGRVCVHIAASIRKIA